MSCNWGKNIVLSIFGESHGKAIGINIGGVPAGTKLDMEYINFHMERRKPGKNKLSTARKENDEIVILSGVVDGVTTGAPICALIYNEDKKSKDYSVLKELIRPGHSDLSAYIKYRGFNDIRGGGHFSGRITAPIVFAGAIARQLLEKKGIIIGARIKKVKDIEDTNFNNNPSDIQLKDFWKEVLPTLDKNIQKNMEKLIEKTKLEQNSVGGVIQCIANNVPAGLGEPFFDSLESTISHLAFSIPAIKGIEFGKGFEMTEYYGSQANDRYYYENEKIKSCTNNNGGILGGISNGMPIDFSVAVKPTPSISLPQETVNIKTKKDDILKLGGRHDPCILSRAVVVIESVMAIAILEHLYNGGIE